MALFGVGVVQPLSICCQMSFLGSLTTKVSLEVWFTGEDGYGFLSRLMWFNRQWLRRSSMAGSQVYLSRYVIVFSPLMATFQFQLWQNRGFITVFVSWFVPEVPLSGDTSQGIFGSAMGFGSRSPQVSSRFSGVIDRLGVNTWSSNTSRSRVLDFLCRLQRRSCLVVQQKYQQKC